SIIAQLGLNHSLVKLVASDLALGKMGRIRSYVLSALKLVLSISILISVLLNSTLGQGIVAELFGNSPLRGEMLYLSLWAILYSLQILLAEIWRGLQKINLATLFGGFTSQSLTLVFLSISFLASQEINLHGIILISLAAVGISLSLCLILMTKYLLRLPSDPEKKMSELMLFSWPFLLTSLTLFLLNQADIWLVGLLYTDKAVASYGAAVRISLLTAMPLAIINAVIPPFIAERYALGNRSGMESLLRKSALLAFLPALFIGLIFIFGGGTLLDLVFGVGYSEGLSILRILTLAYLVHIFFGSPGYSLMMSGYQKQMMIITAGAALISISLGYYLGHELGPTGVAWGSFTGLSIQTLGMWIFVRMKLKVWTHPRRDSWIFLRDILFTFVQKYMIY
ncbi:MAG: oligosaccharide flippase family protein, partial [Bdellovibrionales bacterium]|nr:oligosaccharide flippase family protein [Bdellovibrionales bacterium]